MNVYYYSRVIKQEMIKSEPSDDASIPIQRTSLFVFINIYFPNYHT